MDGPSRKMNGYSNHNGNSSMQNGSSSSSSSIVSKEMCFYCFEVLNNKLNNMDRKHIDANFTNDSQ